MNKHYYDELQETFYTKKLENGLTVFLLPKLEMSKAYGIFSTNYGSIDQTFTPLGEDEMITVPKGVAHFLEHKLFEKEDGDVFTDFSKQGASANAFTSFTQTAYLFSSTDNISKNVTTLIDFVQEPYFTKESVEKEKGIIAQEIKMYDDQPKSQAFMGTIKGLFHNHPVNNDIAGTVDSIQEITKQDLYTCYNTFYHPENMTFFLAGKFNVEEIMTLIEKNQNNKKFIPLERIQRETPYEPQNAVMKENKIIMSVNMPKCTVGIKETNKELLGEMFVKKELLTEMILSHYFSRGGLFYQELYETDVIDRSFYYGTNIDRSFGYTIIGGNTTDPDIFAKKVKELLLSTNRRTISKDDIDRMKKKKVGQFLRGMNSLEFIANNYIHYHSVDVNLFDLTSIIQSITEEEVNSFLEKWIEPDRLTVFKIEDN